MTNLDLLNYDLIRKIGAKCVLYSSDQVYFGSSEQNPHREDEVLTSGNVYGRQKLEAEERCLVVNPDSVLDVRREGEHGDFLRIRLPKLMTQQSGWAWMWAFACSSNSGGRVEEGTGLDDGE